MSGISPPRPDLSAEVFVLEPEAADADHPVNGESS
jgi:hypothetical protein